MTTYIQSADGSLAGTFNKVYFGCDLTDSDWYSQTITSIKFTLARESGSGTYSVECYQIEPNGTTETLLSTESISITTSATAYTWTFSTTLSSTGGYIMLKGLPQDIGEAVDMSYDTTPVPVTSSTVIVSTKLDAAASPSSRSGEYPTTEIEFGVAQSGTRLPPPPIVLGGL